MDRRGTHSFSRRTLLRKDIYLATGKDKVIGIRELNIILKHAAA
jgi:hypothetical protein